MIVHTNEARPALPVDTPAEGDATAPPPEHALDDTLVVVETDRAFFVAWAGDLEDWVACFHKRPGFPAQVWAEHMAELHGQRRWASGLIPPTP